LAPDGSILGRTPLKTLIILGSAPPRALLQMSVSRDALRKEMRGWSAAKRVRDPWRNQTGGPLPAAFVPEGISPRESPAQPWPVQSVLPQTTATWDSAKTKTSRDLPGPSPRTDKEREMRQAVVRDADKTEGKDRDLEHGEGGTLGLDKPEDIRRDD
ncbi:hypothetical protein, partial [Bradyrhizobium sp.]|uniref:hypothetical protein n=1 Tax=Bradyrhizobium sp. TaxID=376 RepID=UPI002396F844